MRYLLFVLLLFTVQISFGSPLQDSLQVSDTLQKTPQKRVIIIDSAALARKNFMRDSITWHFMKPDPNRPNPYVEKLLADNVTNDPYLLSLPKNYKKVTNSYGLGNFINGYPKWFLPTTLILLCFFAIIRIAFKKELSLIFKAFFDDRTLSQIGKEDNILFTWQFLFLYFVFSLTVGLFVCLVLYKIKASNAATDLNTFLFVSLFAFLFFGIKILIIKFLGFLFEIQKITQEYITIIYLTYFNTLFILLPATFILSLLSISAGYLAVRVFLLMVLSLIVFQFVRITIKILLNHQLSKFYLFIYLCTLEICPIILLAKTIDISL